jgi:hypothetical protein
VKQINPYLKFNGNCREAMTFYKNCLGGELTLNTVAGSPMEAARHHQAAAQPAAVRHVWRSGRQIRPRVDVSVHGRLSRPSRERASALQPDRRKQFSGMDVRHFQHVVTRIGAGSGAGPFEKPAQGFRRYLSRCTTASLVEDFLEVYNLPRLQYASPASFRLKCHAMPVLRR